MKDTSRRPTLGRPAIYQIRVPGHPGDSWLDWVAEIKMSVERDSDGLPVTTLTGCLDQAALQSLLRRLYSVGLPLISVSCVADDCLDEDAAA
jgi:hypothetical protein